MELYGPRAAQYQYHGRAEVTPRGARSTSTLSPSCDSNDECSNEVPKQGEHETPMEEIVLGGRYEKRVAEHEHESAFVKGDSPDKKRKSGLGIQSGGDYGQAKEENNNSYDDECEGGSMSLSAGDTARVYLRQLLEGGDKKIDPGRTPTAKLTHQSAAEPSGQDSGESSDGYTSAHPALPLTADIRTSPLNGHEEDTDEKYEIKSFQRLFDPGCSASAVGQNPVRRALHSGLSASTLSTLPSSMLSCSGSSVSVASVHSSSSVLSSVSQSPSQRTRNLKNKRRVIRSTKNSSQPSVAANLDQIMPTKARGRNSQGGRTSSGCSVSSGRTFYSTDPNLCPINEDGSHGEYAEDDGDPAEGQYSDNMRRRSSGPFSAEDEDFHNLPSQIVTVREKSIPRELERSESSQRSIPEGSDVDADRFNLSQKEKVKWRIDTEDFQEGSKKVKPSATRSNSRRHFLAFKKFRSTGTLISSEAGHQGRHTEDVRLVEGHSDESDSDRYISVVDFNGRTNHTLRGKSRKTKIIQFITEPTVTAKRVCCIFSLLLLVVLFIFFITSTTLHKNRTGELEEGDNLSGTNHINDLESLPGQDNSVAGMQSSESTTILSSSVILETVVTTLEPLLETDLFMVEDDSPQHLALSWILNVDPLAVGKALTVAQGNNTQQSLVFGLKTQLLQRFVLASFYFASSPEEWNHSQCWLSAHHECEWFGIECEGYFPHAPMSNGTDSHQRHLDASVNKLNNTIIDIELSENNIVASTGIVPDIKALNHLRTLDLSNNQISGELGEWIGKLKELEVIRLNGNSFGGQIPKSLSSLQNLVELRLENNSFSGSDVPRGMCHLVNLSILTADCGSSRRIYCECCTECFGNIENS